MPRKNDRLQRIVLGKQFGIKEYREKEILEQWCLDENEVIL